MICCVPVTLSIQVLMASIEVMDYVDLLYGNDSIYTSAYISKIFWGTRIAYSILTSMCVVMRFASGIREALEG